MVVMATRPEGSVRDRSGLQAPAITGLVELLGQHVRDRPDAPALVVTSDRVPVSYRALTAVVDDVAVRLGSTGLRRGDTVGLVAANTAEFVVGLLGAARAGLVVAPLDPTLPHPQMSARLEDLGVQAILVGPPADGTAPDAQFGSPTWELRVDVSAGGGRKPPLISARVWCETSGAQRASSRRTTRLSCSPRALPTGPRWSR